MSLEEIIQASKRMQRHDGRGLLHRAELYRLIREAREQGASWGKIAKAANLSRERIRQVCGAGQISK